MTTKRQKKYASSDIVSERMLPSFNKRCKDALATLGISPMMRPIPILGTRPLDKDSIDTYHARLRAFVSFLLQHPEYDSSMALFYPYTPKGTVICHELPVFHFLISRCNKKGTPLLGPDDKSPFTNGNGKQYIAMGGWNDPGACDGFRAALRHVITNAHGIDEAYVEPCELCRNVYDNNNSMTETENKTKQNKPASFTRTRLVPSFVEMWLILFS